MDSSKSDVQVSMAEYLEKEKLCLEICETITKSVEEPQQQGQCTFPPEASSLLPELNSDEDVEEILQQISDLLGSQFGDNSQCTDIDGAEDLSIDEILRQAEQIVRSSTPYFEKKTYNSCTGVEPLLEPIRKNINQLAKRTSTSTAQPNNNRNSSSHQVCDIKAHKLEVTTDVLVEEDSDLSTSTNDSDDDEFESPISESPRVEGSPSLRKSCSDSDCHLKAVREVRKSSSAGLCSTAKTSKETIQRPEVRFTAQGKGTESRPLDLTLADLNVPEPLTSKESAAFEAITTKGNPVTELAVSVREMAVSDGVITKLDGSQFNVETANLPPPTNLVEPSYPNHATSPEPVRKSDSHKHPDRPDCPRPVELPLQSTSTIKHHELPNPKTRKSPAKSTGPNSKGFRASEEEPGSHCSNEQHCPIITDLKAQINSFTAKIAEFEKNEDRARKAESLAMVERQRNKMLQDEVRSQEELIVGYQMENQRLSNDIICAKRAEQLSILTSSSVLVIAVRVLFQYVVLLDK